jgi:tetratricopeptide (TPR) repeat protein
MGTLNVRRIAVCLSGQLRQLEGDNSVLALIRRLNADVFVSTWEDLGATSAYDRFFPCQSIANMLIDRSADGKYIYDRNGFMRSYPNIHNLFYQSVLVDEDYIRKNIPNVKAVRVEKFPADFGITRSLNGIQYPQELLTLMPERYMFSLPMFYKIHDCYELAMAWAHTNRVDYDIVVRVRCDLEFNDLDKLEQLIQGELSEDVVYTSMPPPGTVYRDIFVNDTFAFGSPEIMGKYASLYKCLSSYWNLDSFPDFPRALRAAECLLGYHLLKNEGVRHKAVDVFSPVKVKLGRKNYTEVLEAFRRDLKLAGHLTVNESRAMCVLLASAFVESGGLKDRESTLEKFAADLIAFPDDTVNIYSQSWLLGAIYKRLNRWDLSLKYYSVAAEFLKDFDSRPALEFATVLLWQERYAESLGVLTPLLVKAPRDYFVMRELGRVHLKLFEISRNPVASMHLEMSRALLKGSLALAKSNRITKELFDRAMSASSGN